MSQTLDDAKELEQQAVHAAEEGVRKARSYVESYPLMMAGVAFAAGVLLSVLLRREE